jgi:hypothetical protein
MFMAVLPGRQLTFDLEVRWPMVAAFVHGNV